MPLRAILNNENFFADDLTEENRNNNYLCPNCPSELIPVIPQTDIIKHFRHKNGEVHHEPETEEHFFGKRVLHKICENLGYSAITEYKIGNHITDVFVESKYPLAIEFQCSKCNSTEIIERTLTYMEKGIVTLWILGKKFYENEKNTLIEKEILKNQSLFYFDGLKFFKKHFSYGNHGFETYHDYSIQKYIEYLLKGKISIINNKNILTFYNAGKMNNRIDTDNLLINLPLRIIHPKDFLPNALHNFLFPDVVELDIKEINDSNGVIAIFNDPEQFGTLVEVLHSARNMSKHNLCIFTSDIINNYNEYPSFSDIYFFKEDLHFGCLDCNYWFLIGYLRKYANKTTIVFL